MCVFVTNLKQGKPSRWWSHSLCRLPCFKKKRTLKVDLKRFQMKPFAGFHGFGAPRFDSQQEPLRCRSTVWQKSLAAAKCILLVFFLINLIVRIIKVSLSPLPPLPTESSPVVTCWCSAQGQCLSISLTAPIKIHSANEPSLSPAVIKTRCLMSAALQSSRPSPHVFISTLPWLHYDIKHSRALSSDDVRRSAVGISLCPRSEPLGFRPDQDQWRHSHKTIDSR